SPRSRNSEYESSSCLLLLNGEGLVFRGQKARVALRIAEESEQSNLCSGGRRKRVLLRTNGDPISRLAVLRTAVPAKREQNCRGSGHKCSSEVCVLRRQR